MTTALGRTVFFALSTLFISLLQFHLDWYPEWRQGVNQDMIAPVRKALSSGPLFFFAITLAVASFFEILYRDELRGHWLLKHVAWVCSLPLFIMIFEYTPVRFGYATVGDPFYAAQLSAATLSLFLASLVRFVTEFY